jgi:DinB superfamily
MSQAALARLVLIASFAVCSSAIALPAQSAQPPAAPAAQPPAQPSSPEADVLRSYNGLKGNILKAADKMPADGYGFRPTPDIRTYARVVNHISEVQLRNCGGLNGTAPDALAKVPAETADKTEIVAALQASFAECDKAYGALSDANLLEKVSIGPLNRARISFAWQTVAHDDEQYATLALYLRLKGIIPPSSEK